MKFTKEEAFEQLKGELTKGGKTPHLSDRSINEYVDNLLEIEKDNEELELDAFIAKYKKPFISMNRNVEHDVSSEVNDFKSDWEKNHPSQQQTQTQQQTQQEQNPELKAVLDRLKVLEDENAEMKAKATLKQKKKDLLAKMKEKGIDNDDWSTGMVAQIYITPDMDVDAKAGELLDFYNKTQAEIPSQSTTPASTSQRRESVDSAIAAASAAAKAAREAMESNR